MSLRFKWRTQAAEAIQFIHRKGPFKSLEEMEKYQELVDDIFASKRYPPVNGLEARVVIQRCWTGEYSDLSAPIAD
ncbi:hypothetical protein PDE_00275 [Penicillium oxalicum 114-2]|uniref:Uncharacterized protein n=1 Tax=Penicillium oxalicum (strain 114-2 / CGMCC 5302) TaxID=933388 RepID=S8AU48_PENO1|nr:hypothetical protein PDE_00275 [Penicillium oxalicum 114-2]